MFRVSAQVGRRLVVRSVRQARVYSSASHGGSGASMSKSALLLAGFSTLGALYVANGCPTLIKSKPASVAAPVSEPVKDKSDAPHSAQDEGAEPVTAPGNETVFSEEKFGELKAAQEAQEAHETQEDAQGAQGAQGAQENTEAGESTTQASGVDESSESSETSAPSLSVDNEITKKNVVLHHEADQKELVQVTGPDGVKMVTKDSEPASETEEKSFAPASPSENENEAKPEQSATAEAAAAGVQGEENNEQKSAYNPETGEINWDCPCLGGMAYGPCGEEFKTAFSCFVYSEAEPKGINCVEKFSAMQNCFRQYPDYYAEQIKDEEEASAEASKIEDKSTTDASTATATVEVETENAVFEPVLEKYVEENPQLKETSEAAPVVTSDAGDKN